MARRPSMRFGRRQALLTVRKQANTLSDWTATSTVDSRTGFASVLPEFDGLVAPEVEDTAALFMTFAPSATSGSIRLGAPVYLEGDLSGTFTGGTLAATGTVGGFALDVAATLSGSVLTGTVTITNGSHEEVRAFTATSGEDSVSIPTGYWVDAVNGNDANDGSSPDQALQTIAGLPAIIASDRVYLARGSRWRELLDTSAVNDCHAVNYGIGPRPILDATNAIAAGSWTKTAGRTNIYQCTVTGENPGGTSYSAVVLQDGWQLEPLAGADLAASLTLVDAAAGTHVVQNMGAGGSVTIYVNLYGATKVPADNQVEISLRPAGFRGKGNVRVEGLLCRSGWATGGALDIQASAAAINTSYVDDCIAMHCNDHNMIVPGGEVRRTVCLGTNSGANANAMIAIYRQSINAADSPLLYEFACIQFSQLTNATLMNTYTAHAGDASDWQDITLQRCYSYYGRGWSVHHGTIDECLFERPPAGGGTMIGVLTVAGQLTITNTRLLGASAGTGYTGTPIQNGAGVLTIDNVASWFPGDTLTGGHVMQRGGTCSISDSYFTATASDVWDDNTTAASVSLSRVSCPRGARVGVSGSTVTPVTYIACLAASDWRENIAATARDFSNATPSLSYTPAANNAYGDLATGTFTTTLPSFEAEADAERPIFRETSASRTARGWDIGPAQMYPGGISWVLPEIGPAWRTFIGTLAGLPT